MAQIRRILTTAASLAFAIGAASALQAQTYPSKDDPRNTWAFDTFRPS